MHPFRRFIAFSVFAILIVFGYLAIKGLSGFDPLKISRSEILGLFTKQGRSVIANLETSGPKSVLSQGSDVTSAKSVLLTFALVADIHSDNDHLAKALVQARQAGAEYVVALGDFTMVGTNEELQAVKTTFDKGALPYYAIPGDHDMWDNKNKGEKATLNFEKYFGKPYYEKQIKGVKQLFVNNANLDSGLTDEQVGWLKVSLEQPKQQKTKLPTIIFVHQPLYHPSTEHIMGRQSSTAANQTDQLLKLFQETHVATVIAGDIHFFTQYTEPTTQIPMTTIGAVTQARNIQKPRFAIMTIYTDGSYNIVDTEIQ